MPFVICPLEGHGPPHMQPVKQEINTHAVAERRVQASPIFFYYCKMTMTSRKVSNPAMLKTWHMAYMAYIDQPKCTHILKSALSILNLFQMGWIKEVVHLINRSYTDWKQICSDPGPWIIIILNINTCSSLLTCKKQPAFSKKQPAFYLFLITVCRNNHI